MFVCVGLGWGGGGEMERAPCIVAPPVPGVLVYVLSSGFIVVTVIVFNIIALNVTKFMQAT